MIHDVEHVGMTDVHSFFPPCYMELFVYLFVYLLYIAIVDFSWNDAPYLPSFLY